MYYRSLFLRRSYSQHKQHCKIGKYRCVLKLIIFSTSILILFTCFVDKFDQMNNHSLRFQQSLTMRLKARKYLIFRMYGKSSPSHLFRTPNWIKSLLISKKKFMKLIGLHIQSIKLDRVKLNQDYSGTYSFPMIRFIHNLNRDIMFI